MPTLKATIQLEYNGIPLPGFPTVRRLEVPEAQFPAYEQADDADSGTFDAMPTSTMSELQFLYITADQQVTLRLDGQSDAGIVLNADGILLLLNCDIDAGSTTNATINNASNSTANVVAIVGGT